MICSLSKQHSAAIVLFSESTETVFLLYHPRPDTYIGHLADFSMLRLSNFTSNPVQSPQLRCRHVIGRSRDGFDFSSGIEYQNCP
jgi:hypothetical protein